MLTWKPSSETKANKSNKAKSKYQNVRDWDITIYDFITNFGFLFDLEPFWWVLVEYDITHFVSIFYLLRSTNADLKMSLYVCVHRKIIHW